MNRDDLRDGLATGIIAATATSGALIAIGRRASTAARPFNTIAGHLVGARRADAFGFIPAVTITGIALHLLLVTMAGVAVVIIARRRFAPVWLASLIITLLAAFASIGIARRGGMSLATLLTTGDLLLFYVTLAISLAVGTRFAPLGESRDSSRRIQTM